MNQPRDLPSVIRPPAFARGSETLQRAWQYAAAAHEGQERKGDGRPYIRHPTEVADLLSDEGITDEAQLAAALLHDVVEDSDRTLDEIGAEFGADVRELVEALTEDDSIPDYEQRKADHRDQVEAAGARAIAIYAADKLANSRDMRTLYRQVGEAAEARFKAPLEVRMRLWRGDVEMARREVPELSVVDALAAELDVLDAERAAITG